MIPPPDACPYPWAMMVHSQDADATECAMVGTLRAQFATDLTFARLSRSPASLSRNRLRLALTPRLYNRGIGCTGRLENPLVPFRAIRRAWVGACTPQVAPKSKSE